jgi:DUF1680 family protein
MNVSRLVASVGGYFISTADDGVAFHIYGGISATREIAGSMVSLRETSNYPWSGDIKINIDPEAPTNFDVKLRIPGWCKGAKIAVNGAVVALKPVDGYQTINRVWTKGDTITLELPMPAERLYAHPDVIMDVGRVALKRGPLVYCIEEADNPGGSVQRLKLPRKSELRSTTRADLFGGAVTLSAEATAIDTSGWTDLYRTTPSAEHEATLTALPYYLWANRGKGSMVVWIPEA